VQRAAPTGVRDARAGTAVPPVETHPASSLAPGRRLRHRVALASALAALTSLAAALRLAGLPGQPGGLHPDEAAEGADAWRLLHEPGFHPVFFDDDGGREGLFAYLVALAFRAGGASVGSLRATSAVLGTLGVLAVLIALRRFGWGAALVAMAWSAGSVWLVSVSRDGFRPVLVPLVGALALWALLRWADRPAWTSALLAGAVCGAGLWTYQPLKVLPALVLLWLLWLRRSSPAAWHRMRGGLGWLFCGYLVVAGPMVATAVLDPTGYFGRGAQVSPLNPEFGASGLPMHILRTLGMFGAVGDPNPRHDAAGLPLLTAPLAVLAVLGGLRAARHRQDPGHALLLVGFGVFLLPPLIAVEGGTPHFLRSLGLAPYVAALVGLGWVEAVALGSRLGGPARRWTAAAIAALCGTALLAATFQGAVAYFTRPLTERYSAYSFDLVALAEAASPPGTTVVIDPYQALVVQFLDRERLPVIAAPGTRLPPGRGRVVARSRQDLIAALGPGAAAAARPAAFDPEGRPVVFEVLR